MPTYEYECEEGHTFEVFQSIKDDPLTECTEVYVEEDDYNPSRWPAPCGAPVRRLISPAGLVFKGSGWTPKHY